MLLASEQEIANLIALAAQRLNHGLRPVRRHDGILFPVGAENSDSNVLVVQPTDEGMRHDAPTLLNPS
jgi:hypothetical protein